MGKAFTHVLRADTHPGQQSRQQVVGIVQAPGVGSLVSAGDMGGIDHQDALRQPAKAPFGSCQQRIEEP